MTPRDLAIAALREMEAMRGNERMRHEAAIEMARQLVRELWRVSPPDYGHGAEHRDRD